MKLSVFLGCLLIDAIYCKSKAFQDQDSQNISNKLKDEICSFQKSSPPCHPSKYRSIDGSCNNKNHPLWGSSYSTFTYLLEPKFSDGISAFRKSVNGSDLPSARLISQKIFKETSVLDPEYTIAMMQFGQVMAHDMSFGMQGIAKSCCQSGHQVGKCDAIPIPKNDPVYGSDGLECLDFVRNVNSDDLKCPGSAGNQPVKHISTPTFYLDLSFLYGDTKEQGKLLRSYKNGLLRTTTKNGHEFPPQDPEAEHHCFLDDPKDTCYLGSDHRINQNPHLTLIQIYYLREHNRIARKLAVINPHWDDDRLFEEARRINIAQYQYVSYYEWLTIFLGDQNMLDKKMIYFYSGDEYVNDYDASSRPEIFSEHANAAYRYFHTQIEGQLQLLTESREVITTIPLSDTYNKPKILEEHFDNLGRGLVTQQSQLTDNNYDPEIHNNLFKNKSKFGQDLRALDIQRGRDHGIAGYNDFREFCGLPRAKNWNDFLDLIAESDVENLREIYQHVDDVELTIGAALEKFTEEEVLAGPTLLCIYNIQFLNTRITDRYWFESGDPEVRFTKSQLAEIRKSSFARLFCDNSNNVTRVQKKAFDTVDEKENPIVKCTEIREVDLMKWKE